MAFILIPGQTGVFEVAKLLPHKGEALQYIDGLVFRLNSDDGVMMVGTKRLSLDNHFFPGHFPGRPMYPGHAIDEGVDLVCGCMGILEYPFRKVQTFYAKAETRFQNPAFPGDTLTFIVKPGRKKEIKGQILMTFDGKVENQKGEVICERSVLGAGM